MTADDAAPERRRPHPAPAARATRPRAGAKAAAPAGGGFPPSLDLGPAGLVALDVRRHPRARRLILRMAPGGRGVRVTAPPGASRRAVLAFLERHAGWITERVGAVPAALPVCPGAAIPWRGGVLHLRHDPALRGHAFEEGDGAAPVLRVGGGVEHFARRVRDVLKREARGHLLAAVARHAPATGLKPASVTLKDTVSRWGSCSHDRRLSFSWRIVMAPPAVLDYLAAHEVAHFRHMDHGAEFWALCRSLCPGTEEARLWLRENGHRLHAVAFG